MIKAVVFDCFGVVLDIMRGTRNEQVIELIKSLPPEFHVAMMTNARSRRGLDERFKPGELDELFEVVVVSGDIGFAKPDPEIYTMTAEKLGIRPEDCLFVDDIKEFCRVAEKVGMQAYHVTDVDRAADDIKRLLGFDKKG